MKYICSKTLISKMYFLCVAACENQYALIKCVQIDLKKEVVATLAGTGYQGRDVVGGKIGCEQALSTPWDIIPYSSAQLSKGT